MDKLYTEISEISKGFKVTPERGLCKLMEETGELAQSVNKTIGFKGPIKPIDEVRHEIVEESADVIQNVFCVASLYGITYQEIVDALTEKNQKWINVYKK